MRDTPFSNQLSDAIKQAGSEISRFTDLESLGLNPAMLVNELDSFLEKSNSLPFNNRSPHTALAVAHQKLSESIGSQLPPSVDGDVKANTDKVLKDVIKKSYLSNGHQGLDYIDINKERESTSTALFGPDIDMGQKRYLLDNIALAPISTQQPLLNAIQKRSEWYSPDFKGIQGSVLVASFDLKRAFEREGLDSNPLNKTPLFDMPYEPNNANDASNHPKTMKDMINTVMNETLDSPLLSKVGLNYIGIAQEITNEVGSISEDTNPKMKMAALHQSLHNTTLNQFEALHGHEPHNVLLSKLDVLKQGLDEVTKEHYSKSEVGFVSMNKIYSELHNDPFPSTDDKQTYSAATLALSKMNGGARQLALSLLDDHKNDSDYDIGQSVDLIKNAANTLDMYSNVLGLEDSYNLDEFSFNYDEYLKNAPASTVNNIPIANPDSDASPMLGVILNHAYNNTNLISTAGMSYADTHDRMVDFESRIPESADNDMRLGLLHHHLEVMAEQSLRANQGFIAGGLGENHTQNNTQTLAQIKDVINTEAFHSAHKSYSDYADIKAPPFLSRNSEGERIKAPFSENLPDSNHKAMLSALMPLTQGQKKFVAQELTLYQNSANRGDPESTAVVVFNALKDFEHSYASTNEQAHDSANKFMRDYSAAHIKSNLLADVPANTQPISDIDSSPTPNSALPTRLLSDDFDGLKAHHKIAMDAVSNLNDANDKSLPSAQARLQEFFRSVSDFDDSYKDSVADSNDVDALTQQKDSLDEARKMVNEVALEAQGKDVFSSTDNPAKPNETYEAYIDTRTQLNESLDNTKDKILVATSSIENANKQASEPNPQTNTTTQAVPRP